MKNLLLIFLILLSTSLFTQAQEIPPKVENDSTEAFLDAHFEGGAKGFLESIYQSINFPGEARNNCNSGISIAKLTFGKNGQIIDLTLYNSLGQGLDEEVIRMIRITQKSWKSTVAEKDVLISFAFRVGEKERISGYINVIAYGPDHNCFHTTKTFQKKLDKAIKKKKYDKAMEYCAEIIKRNPWSEEHHKLYDELKQK